MKILVYIIYIIHNYICLQHFIIRKIYKQLFGEVFHIKNFFYSYRAQIFIKSNLRMMLFEKTVFENLVDTSNYISDVVLTNRIDPNGDIFQTRLTQRQLYSSLIINISISSYIYHQPNSRDFPLTQNSGEESDTNYNIIGYYCILLKN